MYFSAFVHVTNEDYVNIHVFRNRKRENEISVKGTFHVF